MHKKIMRILIVCSVANVMIPLHAQEVQGADQPIAVETPIPAQEAVQTSATIAQPAQEQPAAAPVQAPVEQLPAQQPIAVSEQPAPDQEEIEIKGIDTVDIAEPKGNWLYKRIWWEKAERVYEKIRLLTFEILESRMIYFNKRHELEHSVLDPFYLNMGLERGGLEEIISYFTQQLDKERQEQGSLDEKERDLQTMIMQEKKTLDQLQQGAQRIDKLDAALDDALTKLMEQISQARHYEQQAWDSFKAINKELSDKRARELYYGMDTYWKNLNSINNYLSDAFAKYFEQLTGKVQQETDTIKTTIQALKEKGIDIQSQALKMKKSCKMPVKEQEQPEEAQESTGFFGTIFGWIKAPFVFVGDIIGGAFDWITSLFGRSSEEVIVAKRAGQATKESIDIESEIQEDQE